MRGRWWVGLVGWVVAAGPVAGQTAVPARLSVSPDLPPLSLPAAVEVTSMPSGTTVSRPLQTVTDPTTVNRPLDPLLPAEVSVLPGNSEIHEETSPLGRSWGAYEYLLWWQKPSPIPSVLGNGSFSAPAASGGRFTFGSSHGESECTGLEFTYLFTGTQTVTAPFVAGPAYTNAVLNNRLTGWEITGVANLLARPDLRVNALAGYRYFMANEGLSLEHLSFGSNAMTAAADQFDAHNRFHGGQFGLRADWTSGPVFVELAGKVGIGQAINVVKVGGQTIAVTSGFPFPGVRPTAGGVYAPTANSGRFVHTGFAVLPEGMVKFGYRFRDRSRMYLGYNFLYLSEAARAGDQVERPADPVTATGVLTQRSAADVVRSDFWVQGLVFGLEYRY